MRKVRIFRWDCEGDGEGDGEGEGDAKAARSSWACVGRGSVVPVGGRGGGGWDDDILVRVRISVFCCSFFVCFFPGVPGF